MEVPLQQGFKEGELIGYGGCGRVYEAVGDGAVACVIKQFDEAGSSRKLISKMTARLQEGKWPSGVMPVLEADFEVEKFCWIMPRMMGVEAVPRTLQNRLSDHPGTYSWKLVRSLARALAQMHERRVAHGNLKPGNVFFDDDGEVLLSDWAMGNMPGIKHFTFTDAVLYQSPEQLRTPEDYLDEGGYRWDVFAFGVLAYRVLTGEFPRCHETFSYVAPEEGKTRREGIQADLVKIARNLEAQPAVTWPDEAQNELEASFRQWIERCLALDPTLRPHSMVEVAAGFAELENKGVLSVEREALMDQRRRAEHRTWRALALAGLATVAAVSVGGLWQLANQRHLREKEDAALRATALEKSKDAALVEKASAELKMTEAQQALNYERELAISRLEASRLIGDHLFSWAMEKGNRNLPPLDGRELRLKRLERYFEDFLTRTASISELADERARVRLQLAEVSLAAGDAPAASKRLSDALAAWKGLPMDAELKLRMATNALLLALLQQSAEDPVAETSFNAAREALGAVPQTEVGPDRLNQLLAILDYHEAKLLASCGEETKALSQLMRATQTLNRIADQRPDAAILRSELADCYLASATILEGMGNLGDAREVRSLASAEFVKLLKADPKNFSLRLDLAGSYGAMAESAVLSGDIAGAESISREAMKLLDELVVEQPDNAEAVARKAVQLGLRAGIQRDRGLSKEAITDYDTAIRMLEEIRASAPENAMISYRLALLWWQKGRMLGMAGRREEEIGLIQKAGDVLRQLETRTTPNGPSAEQLQSAGAYLQGDLGHSLQLSNQKVLASEAFRDAVALWEGLLRSRPQSEEYTEGLEWCRQRLKDLN